MSNYLFVAGETGSVQKLVSHFKDNLEMDEQQISTHKITNEKSIFVIERRNKEIESSILIHPSSEGVYFRGQALDHESSSMILGVKGFFEFQEKFSDYKKPMHMADFEGSFILARWDENKISIQSDLYSMYRLIYFASNEIIIASDSLVLIAECMKVLGIKREINRDTAIIKAWNLSGLPNSPISRELIVKDTFTVQVGGYVEVNWFDNGIDANIRQRNVIQLFERSTQSYNQILRDCVKRMYSTIKFSVDSFSPVIEFGLSGGIDSRTLLSLCLQSNLIMDRLVINTNPSPTRIKDYNVVESLSVKYGFVFNDKEKRRQLLSPFNSERTKIENTLGFWKLASLGTYDSFYMTTHFFNYPCILSMSGVGAEPVKQTLDKSKIGNFASNQHPEVTEKVRSKLTESVSLMGIDPESNEAMKWFHMSYKAAYHLGFKMVQSSMLLRPYVGKSIFSIALSENNPFKGKSNEGPTVLHDMMILLDPELASLPYDSENKNISLEYAIKRQEELGGPIELSEMPSPMIFGEIKHIANGPAKCFLDLVNDFNWNEGEPDRTQLARIVKHNYENKIPNDLKDIYSSCYEKTLQNLSNDKIELSAAGAMAARFIVFDLFDK